MGNDIPVGSLNGRDTARTPYARTMSTDAPTAVSSSPVTPKRKRFGVRTIAAGLCLALATVLLPFGLMSFWGQKTLTDTERFVATVQPLASDPQIIDTIADTVATALTKNVDLEAEVEKVLPPVAESLAGPIAAAIPMFVKQVTIKLLSTEQFRQIWTKATGTLQSAIIKVLSGETDGPVSAQNGQIVLDTGAVIDEVKKRLVDKGLTWLADRPTPPAADREIVLLDSEQVAQAQTIYKLTVPIATWLIVLVALLFVGAIALAHRRAWMVAYVGVGTLIGAGVLRLALAVAPDFISNSFIGTPFQAASVVFFNTLTSYLKAGTALALIIGILLVVGGWIFSDQKYAIALRNKVDGMRNPTPPAPPAASTL